MMTRNTTGSFLIILRSLFVSTISPERRLFAYRRTKFRSKYHPFAGTEYRGARQCNADSRSRYTDTANHQVRARLVTPLLQNTFSRP